MTVTHSGYGYGMTNTETLTDDYGVALTADDRMTLLRLELLMAAKAEVYIRRDVAPYFDYEEWVEVPAHSYTIRGRIESVYVSDGVACNIISDDRKSFHIGPLYGTYVHEVPAR